MRRQKADSKRAKSVLNLKQLQAIESQYGSHCDIFNDDQLLEMHNAELKDGALGKVVCRMPYLDKMKPVKSMHGRDRASYKDQESASFLSPDPNPRSPFRQLSGITSGDLPDATP